MPLVVLDHLNARLRLCRNAAMWHLMKRFAPARKAVNSMVFRLSAGQFKEDLLQQLFGPAPSLRKLRAGQQDDLAAPVPVPDSVRESVALLADGNDYEEPC